MNSVLVKNTGHQHISFIHRAIDSTAITLTPCYLPIYKASYAAVNSHAVPKQKPVAVHTVRVHAQQWLISAHRIVTSPQGPSLTAPAQQFPMARMPAANCFQGLDSYQAQPKAWHRCMSYRTTGVFLLPIQTTASRPSPLQGCSSCGMGLRVIPPSWGLFSPLRSGCSPEPFQYISFSSALSSSKHFCHLLIRIAFRNNSLFIFRFQGQNVVRQQWVRVRVS